MKAGGGGFAILEPNETVGPDSEAWRAVSLTIPDDRAVGGMLGGQAGGAVGKLGNLASLAGGFKQLGLDAGMISKFMPIVLNFFQSKGGDAAKGLLAGTLK